MHIVGTDTNASIMSYHGVREALDRLHNGGGGHLDAVFCNAHESDVDHITRITFDDQDNVVPNPILSTAKFLL